MNVSINKEQSDVQKLLTILAINGRNNKAYYHSETRRLLEAARSGTLKEDEKSILLRAVQNMNKEAEPAKNSAYDRQNYIIALKYLVPERLTNKDIAKIVNVDVSTLCLNVNRGISRLAFWIFGIQALDWQ